MEVDVFKQISGLKVVHLNARSVLKHFEEISSTFLDGETAIVAISETWLHKNVATSLIHCDGYYLLRNDRRALSGSGSVKTGGGVCMYVRNDLQVTLNMSLNISNEYIELLACTISKEKQKKIDVMVAYRPPSAGLQGALDSLAEALDLAGWDLRGEKIILGDLNIDFAKNDSNVKKVNQVMRKWNLTQHVSQPTRVTKSTATKIDVIFSNVGYVKSVGVLNSNISDHLPIFLIKKKPREE